MRTLTMWRSSMRKSTAIALLFWCLTSATLFAADRAQITPLLRTVDINIGETTTITLCNGKSATVKLLDVKEPRDDLRQAIREAVVTVEVNGKKTKLVACSYRLPKTVGKVRIDCAITKGYNSNSSSDSWGLEKDARLRLWPADSPAIRPGTFMYPARQRWFATDTQMANVPTFVDGGESPARKSVYYHSGLDIGGAEGLVEVVAATDALVVSSGLVVLEGHKTGTPVSPRYDVVYLLDARGWYYRYSHMKEIDKRIVPGRTVKMGERVGLLGKEGGSGGWSHLHFEAKSRQPSGKWGTQQGYVFLWEAYLREHAPQMIAVARPHRLIWAGEKATLDASRSWSATGKIASYQWKLNDGSKAVGPKVTRRYKKPGRYSEVVKVTDSAGNIAYDFGIVLVVDKSNPDRIPPAIHPAFYPTTGIKPGGDVIFKVRTFNTQDGQETWDFGDGSEPVQVKSDGNAVKLAKDGYAVTKHRFAKPGDYVVRVERTDSHGVKAVGHLHVRVAE
jgi:murein DD-endopeptidase MepM/ murein hydrolase activator NlpD